MALIFCSVAIGNLGEAGEISLKSILRIPDSKIVAFVDTEGKRWICELLVDKQIHFEKIYFIEISDDDEEVLNLLDNSIEYRPFGNPKFFRLMYFKWIVLQEALSRFSQERFILFTDLDVYWAKSPESSLSQFMDSEANFAVQQDIEPRQDRVFLCPGIMVWKTNSSSKLVLESIRAQHELALKSNPLMPDDKFLNVWASETKNRKLVHKLNQFDYVIGHRLIYLLGDMKGFSLGDFVAFHANYTIGVAKKVRMLKFAGTNKFNYSSRLAKIIFLIASKLVVKINLKSRMKAKNKISN